MQHLSLSGWFPETVFNPLSLARCLVQICALPFPPWRVCPHMNLVLHLECFSNVRQKDKHISHHVALAGNLLMCCYLRCESLNGNDCPTRFILALVFLFFTANELLDSSPAPSTPLAPFTLSLWVSTLNIAAYFLNWIPFNTLPVHGGKQMLGVLMGYWFSPGPACPWDNSEYVLSSSFHWPPGD